MGGAGGQGGQELVKPHLKTRRERQTREALKRAGVWVFLVAFVVSVVGVALVVTIGR